jgi:hypothetical protein
MSNFIAAHPWHFAFLAVAVVALFILYDALYTNPALRVTCESNLDQRNSDGAVFFRTSSGSLHPVYFKIHNKEKPTTLTRSQMCDLCEQVRKLAVIPQTMTASSIDLYMHERTTTIMIPKTA